MNKIKANILLCEKYDKNSNIITNPFVAISSKNNHITFDIVLYLSIESDEEKEMVIGVMLLDETNDKFFPIHFETITIKDKVRLLKLDNISVQNLFIPQEGIYRLKVFQGENLREEEVDPESVADFFSKADEIGEYVLEYKNEIK